MFTKLNFITNVFIVQMYITIFHYSLSLNFVEIVIDFLLPGNYILIFLLFDTIVIACCLIVIEIISKCNKNN